MFSLINQPMVAAPEQPANTHALVSLSSILSALFFIWVTSYSPWAKVHASWPEWVTCVAFCDPAGETDGSVVMIWEDAPSITDIRHRSRQISTCDWDFVGLCEMERCWHRHVHKHAHTHTALRGMSVRVVPAVYCRQGGVGVKYEPMCPAACTRPMCARSHTHAILCQLISETSGSAYD